MVSPKEVMMDNPHGKTTWEEAGERVEEAFILAKNRVLKPRRRTRPVTQDMQAGTPVASKMYQPEGNVNGDQMSSFEKVKHQVIDAVGNFSDKVQQVNQEWQKDLTPTTEEEAKVASGIIPSNTEDLMKAREEEQIKQASAAEKVEGGKLAVENTLEKAAAAYGSENLGNQAGDTADLRVAAEGGGTHAREK